MTQDACQRSASVADVLSTFVGAEVLRCCVDDALTIECRGVLGVAKVKLDADFILCRAETKWTLNSDARPSEIGPAIGLVGLRVASIEIGEDATLEAFFSEGTTVTVRPDDVHRVWELEARGRSITCLPEGGLLVTELIR